MKKCGHIYRGLILGDNGFFYEGLFHRVSHFIPWLTTPPFLQFAFHGEQDHSTAGLNAGLITVFIGQ